MKKAVLLSLIILLGTTLHSFSQKLEENKIDEFTKNTVKRTSWETLCSTLFVNVHFRISLIDGNESFDLKIMTDDQFAIDKDQEIMFKLDDDEIIKFQNLQYTTTCEGCGAVGFVGSEAPGIQVLYPLSKEDAEKLKAHKVLKVRIYTDAGYIENDIKTKNANKITAALNLIAS